MRLDVAIQIQLKTDSYYNFDKTMALDFSASLNDGEALTYNLK